MLNRNRIENIDLLVQKLSKEKDKWISLAIAIDLADEIMKVILPNNPKWTSCLNHDAQNTGKLPKPLPNDIYKNKKQESWFMEHPEIVNTRTALKHFNEEDCVVESNFFWFSEASSKQRISVASDLTRNWEDSELTRKPTFKVGIDFFLNKDADCLLFVISNKHKLRVMELNGKLSNTQKQIFEFNLYGAANHSAIEIEKKKDFQPQKTIHTSLWNALQLREVNKEFYNLIANYFSELVETLTVQNNIERENAKQFSSRMLGRLLFTWFLRKMDIVYEDYGYFYTKDLTSTEYYEKKLKLLFFNTFNTSIEKRRHLDLITPYLNGGLFEPKENDYLEKRIEFPINYFERLYGKFDEFNFTIDESSSDYELIAVDPEMLGQVFETLLASQITESGENERSTTGSFYTPREVVDYMCKEALRKYLYKKINNEQFNSGIDFLLDSSDKEYLAKKSTSQVDIWGVNSKNISSKIITSLHEFKALDPACGSGAFPMGLLHLLLKTFERLETRFDSYARKLSIIENSIFGVDIQPMAVEISRLRAWLSVIVDEKDKENIKALPNLDFKFICANTLIPLEKQGNLTLSNDMSLDVSFKKLREKYFKARKPEMKKKYQDEYYNLTRSVSLFDKLDLRAQQLKSFDPFKNRRAAEFFDSHFMFGIEEGFDVVIGNPPYAADFSEMDKMKLNRAFPQVPDYESSYYFVTISKELLTNIGLLTYIIPNTFLTNLYAKNFRMYLLEKWQINSIDNLSDCSVFDSATVRNCILTLQNNNEVEEGTSFIHADVIEDIYKRIKIEKFNKEYLINNNDSWLNIFYRNPEQYRLLEKIRNNSKILDEFTNSSQGITPYDKYRGTPPEIIKSKGFEANYKKDETYKEFLKGKDVKRYSLKWNGNHWISYGEWLANPREPKYFKNPRILFREITNPYIYATYTEEEYYNNPSIINTTDFNGINPYYILGLVNSKLINFYHRKNSPKSNKGAFPKLLINDVRQIPIKIGDIEQVTKIIDLVTKIIANNESSEMTLQLNDEIDSVVYEIYLLTNSEIKIVEELIQRDWLK